MVSVKQLVHSNGCAVWYHIRQISLSIDFALRRTFSIPRSSRYPPVSCWESSSGGIEASTPPLTNWLEPSLRYFIPIPTANIRDLTYLWNGMPESWFSIHVWWLRLRSRYVQALNRQSIRRAGPDSQHLMNIFIVLRWIASEALHQWT
jgi:hypothetical protein